MDLVVGIVVAIVLGALLGVLIARLRTRRASSGSPPRDVAGLLRSYRQGHYGDVVDAAPGVARDLGDGSAWRARVELVWGHSLFQLDRYEEAATHLGRGLDGTTGPLEAEARFVHCLGYAYQRTGRREEAMRTYEALLDDPDLDPSVRRGVERNLSELRTNGER